MSEPANKTARCANCGTDAGIPEPTSETGEFLYVVCIPCVAKWPQSTAPEPSSN